MASRFNKLASKLKRQGAKSPRGLAAYLGRKKYGKKRFQKMASRGRKGR